MLPRPMTKELVLCIEENIHCEAEVDSEWRAFITHSLHEYTFVGTRRNAALADVVLTFTTTSALVTFLAEAFFPSSTLTFALLVMDAHVHKSFAQYHLALDCGLVLFAHDNQKVDKARLTALLDVVSGTTVPQTTVLST